MSESGLEVLLSFLLVAVPLHERVDHVHRDGEDDGGVLLSRYGVESLGRKDAICELK